MNYNEAVQLIVSAKNILLTSHTRTDGDAVGSMAALQRLIELTARRDGRRCSTQLLVLSRIPDNYQFLLNQSPLFLGQQITKEQIEAGELDRFDLIIIVDTSSRRQLAGLGEYLARRKKAILIIDHHLAGDVAATCRLHDTAAAASSEIIFHLARHAGWPLDPQVASALFVALGTDTGWFRFSNANARAYQIAAELVSAGAVPQTLYQKLFQNFPPERVKLLAGALQSLELHCEGRLALMQITNQLLNETHAKRTHIENIINESQQIGSVTVSVLLVEQNDGTTRVSLRSRGTLDVNALAGQFGGGGHAQAAGATLELDLPQAREKIIAAVTAAMEQNTSS